MSQQNFTEMYNAYFTLVWSQLEYAFTVWSPWLCKDKLELEKIQR